MTARFFLAAEGLRGHKTAPTVPTFVSAILGGIHGLDEFKDSHCKWLFCAHRPAGLWMDVRSKQCRSADRIVRAASSVDAHTRRSQNFTTVIGFGRGHPTHGDDYAGTERSSRHC